MHKHHDEWRRDVAEKNEHVISTTHCSGDTTHRAQSLSPECSTPHVSDKELEWKPTRRGLTSNNVSCATEMGANEYDSKEVQEAVQQELVDLLRMQITRLLEENEKILTSLDDYREQLRVLQREQRESAPDLSAEHMAIQTELGESRLREAELTIAFSELQERISAIDRMIETDPEIETFFNAVTISTTSLSKQKPVQRTLDPQSSSPNRLPHKPGTQVNRELPDNSPMRRNLGQHMDSQSPKFGPKVICTGQQSMNTRNNNPVDRRRNEMYPNHVNIELDKLGGTNRSGMDSPQSDSGCSLNSHSTSEANELNPFDDHDPHKMRRSHLLSMKHQSEQVKQNRTSQYEEDFEQSYGEDRTFKDTTPRGFVSLLRRSRSTAADHPYAYGEVRSPLSVWNREDALMSYGRHTDDTPTPTEASSGSGVSEISAPDESKSSDRFSRFRASFRKSLGLGPAKPDFRMEALAARQGEARALLSLRETRMELLRVQSRCQTLQRHVDRLEAVNTSRMEELEASVTCDRELRQNIRTLQRRIFEMESDHREFRVNQRIRQMELMSKLAEANLRLSHVELASQQAVVWSELNKAHEAASGLLTSAQSHLSVYPLNGSEPHSPGPNNNGVVERTERNSNHRNTTSHILIKPYSPLEHASWRTHVACRGDESQNRIDFIRIPSSDDLSSKAKYNDSGYEIGVTPKLFDPKNHERIMDQSLGSLSELRLQTDLTLGNRSTGWQ